MYDQLWQVRRFYVICDKYSYVVAFSVLNEGRHLERGRIPSSELRLKVHLRSASDTMAYAYHAVL